MLEVKDLWKSISGMNILKGVSLYLDREETVSLLGPNGSGKTTLMKVIVGIYEPTKGTVKIDGKRPKEARDLFAYVPQEGGLREELSGRQNVCFFSELYSVSCSEALGVVKEVLDFLGIEVPLNKPVEKYSGGMKKALSLAISFVHGPRLLVLDEPTVALDPSVRKAFWELIDEYKRKGNSVLFATHYVEEAEKFSDKVYIIYKGEVVASGTPEELKRLVPEGVVEVELEGDDAEEVCERLGCFVKGKKLAFPSDDPDEEVPKIIDEIYALGRRIRALEVRKPTLEDVFIKLVGEKQ